jgi:hypothetical protein
MSQLKRRMLYQQIFRSQCNTQLTLQQTLLPVHAPGACTAADRRGGEVRIS